MQEGILDEGILLGNNLVGILEDGVLDEGIELTKLLFELLGETVGLE
jgi:hypothetical protein